MVTSNEVLIALMLTEAVSLRRSNGTIEAFLCDRRSGDSYNSLAQVGYGVRNGLSCIVSNASIYSIK